jgi:Flp pilus assembly protein CpaB
MAGTLHAERSTLGRDDGGPRRTTHPRRPPTSGRAILGGLLVTVAVLGTFAAVRSSSAAPEQRYVVATRSVDVGERITRADLDVVALDLPSGVAAHAFTDVAALDGAVALAPLRAGSLVGASQVRTGPGVDGIDGPSQELSLRLPREQAVDGTLDRGEWVDVVATYGSGPEAVTHVIARDAAVTSIGAVDDAGLGDDGGITLTLQLPDDDTVLRLVHAKDVATITLVRATRGGSTDGPDEYPGPVDDAATADTLDPGSP